MVGKEGQVKQRLKHQNQRKVIYFKMSWSLPVPLRSYFLAPKADGTEAEGKPTFSTTRMYGHIYQSVP